MLFEESKDSGGLPPVKFLQQVVPCSKHGNSSTKQQTTNFLAGQENLFEQWALQSSSWPQVLHIPASTPCYSDTPGLPPDAWTWLRHMLELISQCWKLTEFHPPACCCCSNLFQHLPCSALLLFHTPLQLERPSTCRFWLWYHWGL